MALYETIDYSLDLSRMIGGMCRMLSLLMARWDVIYLEESSRFSKCDFYVTKGQDRITGLSS